MQRNLIINLNPDPNIIFNIITNIVNICFNLHYYRRQLGVQQQSLSGTFRVNAINDERFSGALQRFLQILLWSGKDTSGCEDGEVDW